MIDAGKLDRRVTLLKPVYNEFEDEIAEAYAPMAQVWAAVNPDAGIEETEGGRTVSRIVVPIIIRYRTDIDERWRIQDGDQTYEIKAIADVARRHVMLQINCEEVQ